MKHEWKKAEKSTCLPGIIPEQVKLQPIKFFTINGAGNPNDEPRSFKKMQEFCDENHFIRVSRKHREIYLSDARKVNTEKLKTVLRFKISLP